MTIARLGIWLGIVILLALLAQLGVACDGGGSLRLVFHSDRDGDLDVYTMALDGADVRQLTNEPGQDYEAAISPDGQTFVFVSDRAGSGEDNDTQLYLMDADGSNVRRLTFGANAEGLVIDDYPHWSPDGRFVTFGRNTISAEQPLKADIWLIEVETGDERNLTEMVEERAFDSTPSFSADGQSVLFESNRDGDFDIFRVSVDTLQVVQLTNEEGIDIEAKESPDGRQVAFASNRDGDFELYVMDADGSNVRQITFNDESDRCPIWSPDGKLLSFFSERDDDREIYVIEPDGSGERRVTNSPGRDEVPNWLPES